MTAKARSLGLTAGFYLNNCACKETRPSCAFTNGSDTCFAGDVAATIDFGFGSVKIDSCGIQRNMSHYSHLFNLSGKAVVLEEVWMLISPPVLLRNLIIEEHHLRRSGGSTIEEE